MFKITRLAQQQTLHSLQRLLKHNNLKLSDLGCSVMYQCIKGTLDQLNLMLNQAVRAHLKHSQAPQTSAQAIDPWSCFDSERENFFPFVAEDVGHLFSSSQIISLSMSAERILNQFCSNPHLPNFHLPVGSVPLDISGKQGD